MTASCTWSSVGGRAIENSTSTNPPSRLARDELLAPQRVLKEAADDELVEAVRRVAPGETCLNPQLGARIAAEPPQSSGPPDDLHSARSRCCE